MLFLFQLTFSILNMFPWFTTQKLPCTYPWIDLIFTTTNLPLSLSEASKASQSKPIRFAAVGTLLGVTLRKHQGFFLQIYVTVHQQFGSTDQPWKSHHPTTHDFSFKDQSLDTGFIIQNLEPVILFSGWVVPIFEQGRVFHSLSENLLKNHFEIVATTSRGFKFQGLPII